jgi:hypothetical protein
MPFDAKVVKKTMLQQFPLWKNVGTFSKAEIA